VEAPSDAAIGMVGLGNMGGRIARRMLAAGHAVIGYDVERGRIAAAGVRGVDDVASLVEQVEIVFMSLPDSSVVEAVVLGDDGVLVRCRAGQVAIDLSTSAPSSSVRLHSMLGERGSSSSTPASRAAPPPRKRER
jgi:3-hydroxyisobutyrate dehydrogenase